MCSGVSSYSVVGLCRAFIDTSEEVMGWKTTRKTATADAPVEVSEQYHRRFKALMDLILLNSEGPLGKVTEHFWRLEYQQVSVLFKELQCVSAFVPTTSMLCVLFSVVHRMSTVCCG